MLTRILYQTRFVSVPLTHWTRFIPIRLRTGTLRLSFCKKGGNPIDTTLLNSRRSLRKTDLLLGRSFPLPSVSISLSFLNFSLFVLRGQDLRSESLRQRKPSKKKKIRYTGTCLYSTINKVLNWYWPELHHCR